MSFKALRANGLNFDLIRSEDIRAGRLNNYSMLFVPGGWASNKLKSLGDKGVSEIREFVTGGGSYLGFCGGAGLATLDGIGLLKVKRKATKERVPSFSGRIRLDLKEHRIWKGLGGADAFVQGSDLNDIFQAWWPSQVLIEDEDIKILATYGDALPDSFSSDLNVGDVAAHCGWPELEKTYAINLDPSRLLGEPAVIEGTSGKGRLILSLIHFDTPDDRNGSLVLKKLWEYLAGEKGGCCERRNNRVRDMASPIVSDNIVNKVCELESKTGEIISFGIRNFLWFWRNPMLLQWRRGVRGLEYCTLYIMMREIAEIIRSRPGWFSEDDRFLSRLDDGLHSMAALLAPFVDQAKQLLVMERLAMREEHITYDKCDNPEIKRIRTELFSNSKSHGGLFKQLLDEMDKVLFLLINPASNVQ